MKLTNLKEYTPDKSIDNVIYLIDDSGLDWYESQHLFTKKYKLAVNKDDVIIAINTDASAIWAPGSSIVEVDSIPDGCDMSGIWCYKDNKVYINQCAVKKKAEKERQRLIYSASIKIEILKDADALSLSKDGSPSKINEWREYRVKISQVDLSTWPDVNWPTPPDA